MHGNEIVKTTTMEVNSVFRAVAKTTRSYWGLNPSCSDGELSNLSKPSVLTTRR